MEDGRKVSGEYEQATWAVGISPPSLPACCAVWRRTKPSKTLFSRSAGRKWKTNSDQKEIGVPKPDSGGEVAGKGGRETLLDTVKMSDMPSAALPHQCMLFVQCSLFCLHCSSAFWLGTCSKK